MAVDLPRADAQIFQALLGALLSATSIIKTILRLLQILLGNGFTGIKLLLAIPGFLGQD